MSFFNELKRRNVIRTALGYLAGSWLLIQIAETIFPLFGLDDSAARMVVLVLAVGFIPVLVISWVFEWTPQGLKKDQGELGDQPMVAANAKTWDKLILIVMALALGFFAFDRFVLAPEREAEIVESAIQEGIEMEQARAAEISDNSLAVLPFANMTGDPENEYFSDGLTETLLHMLANLQDLKVSARTSSFAFKDQNIDIREIALKLGVAHVLEGSVQQSGNMVRVTAQLIRAEDGFHVWSEKFDRPLDHVFAIQDEIATEVADMLGSSLLDDISGVNTSDLSAYDLYLQGIEQYRMQQDDSLIAADELFRQALDIDPEFHDARIALVLNNIWRERKSMVPKGSTVEESFELVTTAAASRPNDLTVRTVSQYVEIQHVQLKHNEKAEGTFDADFNNLIKEKYEGLFQEFSKGFGDPYVRRMTANWLRIEDREEDEYKLLREGLEYDPLNFDLIQALASSYFIDKRWPEAHQTLLIALELVPDNPVVLRHMSNLEWERGNFPEMLDWLRQGIEADPGGSRLVLNMSVRLHIVGMDEEASYWADRTREMEPDRIDLHEYLDIQEAQQQGDHERIAEIAQAALTRTLNNDTKDNVGFPTTAYVRAMHHLGRSSEAGSFLESLVPSVFDTSALPANWELGELKFSSFELLQDLVSHEEFVETQQTYIATVDAAGIPWRDDKYLLMNVEFQQGNFDLAKSLFIEIVEESKVSDMWWAEFIDNPWLVDLHNDPEVAAILAEHERELIALREQISTMFKRPEWRY